jgi:hypothetical protein
MIFEHYIDQDRRRLVAIFHGKLGYDEILAHLRRRIQDGTLAFDTLADMTDATLDLHYSDSCRLSEFISHHLKDGEQMGRTALLAGSLAGYGVNRMYATTVEPYYRVCAFRTRGNALDWLGWH